MSTVTSASLSTRTLVKLSAGDRIQFNVYSDLVNVGLAGAREDTFFTIEQVK